MAVYVTATFSQVRQLINDFRHHLRHDWLNAMLTLKSWYELLLDDALPLTEEVGVSDDVEWKYNGMEEEEDGYVVDEFML